MCTPVCVCVCVCVSVSVWVYVVFWLICEVGEYNGGKLWAEVDYYNSLSLAHTEK